MSVGYNGYVAARFDDFCCAKGNCVVFIGDVLDSGSVEDFWFHEDNGVIMLEDGGEEKALSLSWRPRHYNLNARNMGK